MKIIRHGTLDTAIATCDRCNAVIEYDQTDVQGSTELTPDYAGGNHCDYTDVVHIKKSWNKMIQDVLIAHYNDYTETGIRYKRDAYVICPDCGNHIDVGIVGLPDEIYPDAAIDENGDIDIDRVCEFCCPNLTIYLLKEHVKEYKEKTE